MFLIFECIWQVFKTCSTLLNFTKMSQLWEPIVSKTVCHNMDDHTYLLSNGFNINININIFFFKYSYLTTISFLDEQNLFHCLYITYKGQNFLRIINTSHIVAVVHRFGRKFLHHAHHEWHWHIYPWILIARENI